MRVNGTPGDTADGTKSEAEMAFEPSVSVPSMAIKSNTAHSSARDHCCTAWAEYMFPSPSYRSSSRSKPANLSGSSSEPLIGPGCLAPVGGLSRRDSDIAPAALRPTGAPRSSDQPLTPKCAPRFSVRTAGTESAVDDEADLTILGWKMQTLGISGFTIEGKPSGHLVFSCMLLIPGCRALAKRFEAEGYNVVQTV